MATLLGNLGSLNAVAALTVDVPAAGVVGVGVGAVAVNLISQAFSGTIVFEATSDGQNWFPVGAYPLLASGVPGGAVLSTTAAGQFLIPVYGYTQVRVRASLFTSGVMLAVLDAATSAPLGQVYANSEGLKPTYSACVSGAALATAGTDLISLQGSATKTLRLLRAIISGTVATAAQYTSLSVIKRSTAGTGGTPGTAPTIVPNDSNDAAATGAVVVYTTSPTALGTPIGIMASKRYFGALTGTPALMPPDAIFDFGVRPGRAPVLRGVNQWLFVNVGAAALANASTWDVTLEWSEE